MLCIWKKQTLLLRLWCQVTLENEDYVGDMPSTTQLFGLVRISILPDKMTVNQTKS